MSVQLKITRRNFDQATAKLRALARRLADWGPVLRDFGVHMIRSVQRTFEAGGRPAAWMASRRVWLHGGKTLIDSARLKNSIVARVTGPRTLRLGTNVVYARVHQLGSTDTVQVPQHIRRVKTRNLYRAETRTSAKTGREYRARLKTATGFAVVKAHTRTMNLPPRPFLVVQDEDREIARAMIVRHVRGES